MRITRDVSSKSSDGWSNDNDTLRKCKTDDERKGSRSESQDVNLDQPQANSLCDTKGRASNALSRDIRVRWMLIPVPSIPISSRCA